MINENFKIESKSSVKYQYLAAVVVNLITVGWGMMEGWSSPSVILLTSNESPLPSGKITMDEASWIASLLIIGCLIGNIVFGYVINQFGRKISLIIIVFPVFISWILVWYAQHVYYLYAARLLGGFFSGGGGYIVVPLFLSEVADDGVRGFLVSTQVLSESAGMLISYTLGHFFGFNAIPIFSIILTIVFAILICFLPETPLFLIKQNKIAAAEKSIQFYQNLRETENGHKLLESEISRLKSLIAKIKSEKSKNDSFDSSESRPNVARKAILIGIILMVLNQLTGVSSMLNYTASIFQETGSNLHPNVSTIVVGFIQLIGNCVATYLVDRCGRKLLIATSAIGMALGLTVLGVYMMLKSWQINMEVFNWIPVTSFSFVIFLAALGVLSLPFIVLAEIMPEKIKDASVSFCMSLLWLFLFILTKYLPSLNESLGFHNSLYMFASVCLGGAAFIILVMPETKCRSHEEIMKSLE